MTFEKYVLTELKEGRLAKERAAAMLREFHSKDSAATHDRVRDVIVASLCETLRIEPREIDPDVAFADYGVDSIVGGHLVGLIGRALGIELATTTLFDYSSLEKLTAHIGTEYACEPPAQTSPSRYQSKGGTEPIAIIGISGRYPQSTNVQELWDHLSRGDDLVQEITRWDHRGLRGAFLEDIDRFDPLFYNISGLEATYMDPQQRLFMQESWHALEDAGYAGADIGGRRCGVYAGYNASRYSQLVSGSPPAQAMWGTSPAIMSGRVAYYLDLHGPAITIDTACSSSLVAMHLACQGLWSGETDLALAGGVCIHSTPEFFGVGSKASMLSPHGRCFTFDDRADGFVLGEGVGVVVLKRLADAVSARDHVYGVIRGSGINQDGATNGITAPSALAQERLEREVYARFGIDPREISLVEAHGTGTKLGDPIEHEALKRAFGTNGKLRYCALGSIKTNIGHAFAAAGVAGVIKVLLALQHRQIPPSLNFATGNSNIDFGNSPFYVNTKLADWTVPPGRKRLAAVSSFGFSGTNAHVVIEEAPPIEPRPHDAAAHLIVLSARTAPELHHQAENLLAFCAQRSQLHCEDLSFTLLVGRRHFDHRLAFVCTRAQLEQVLRGWLNGSAQHQVYAADLSERNPRLVDSLIASGERCIRECRDDGDEVGRVRLLNRLADLYTQGCRLSFAALFDARNCGRIPLPAYPFAGDRYWPEGSSSPLAAAPVATALLHPLLDRNCSGLDEQRYTCRFTGQEFFLADHHVAGSSVLPAVAYLEMARAAVADASRIDSRGKGPQICLTDNIWVQPLTVSDGGIDAHITLRVLEDGSIHYKIHSDSESGRRLHSKGVAQFKECSSERLDLDRLRSSCNGPSIEGKDCYALYRAHGIEHGPSLQGIESSRVGKDERGQCFLLARLRLPDAVRAEAARYVLHPSLMDAAFQSTLGFFMTGEPGTAASTQSLMPFGLDELAVLDPNIACSWVFVAPVGNAEHVRKFDMRLCDGEGRVGVVVRGLTSRVKEHTPTVAGEQTVMLAPTWDIARPEVAGSTREVDDATVFFTNGGWQREILRSQYPRARHYDVSGTESLSDLAELLKPADRLAHVIWVAPAAGHREPAAEALIADQRIGVLACFRLMKTLLESGCGSRDLELTIVTQSAQAVHRHDRLDPTHASVHGLIGALAMEQSRWRIRLVDAGESPEWPWSQMLLLPTDAAADAWAYRHGEWYRQSLLPCDVPTSTEPVYRKEGVYLVIGGAGGIGRAFSEHLITDYGAHVIWIGRRQEDDEMRACRRRLASFGPEPQYIQADATDRRQLERARDQIKQRYGVIHGVVHSAIVLLDRSLANMDEQRFTRALAAKVDVSVRLAQTFEAEALDFVLFFSGLQSFRKGAGQSNYAAGCTFGDAHARQLAQTWKARVKVINWGYWGSVGIVASDAYRQRMAQVGIGSIEPDEGMLALERLLAGPFEQLGFIKITRPDGPWGPQLARERICALPTLLPSWASDLKQPQETPAPESRTESDQYERFDACIAALLGSELAKVDRAKVRSVYSRWYAESIRQLQARGYLDVTAAETSDPWKVWNDYKHVWLASDDLRPLCLLAEATLAALPAILTGKLAATDILFPSSSLNTVQQVYQGNAPADRFNDILSAQVRQYVAERVETDPAARLRLFEIGAGTGSTSSSVFAALKGYDQHIEEYCYTDISKAFLLHAEDRYRPHAPYLTSRLFNAERSPQEQSIELGAYDVVIATNVLHATRSIRQSLRHAKALLRSNGLLIVNEIVGFFLATHVTFGLLEGWWRFEDDALRIPGTPALTGESWRRVLDEEGFRVVSAAIAAYDSRQEVIVAESDGIVRRRGSEPMREADPKPTSPRAPSPRTSTAPDGALEESLRARCTTYLKNLVAQTLRIKPDAINAREPLQSYGIDSILIVQITDTLKQSIPGVTSTLLFEEQTIAALVDFFVRKERAALMRLVGLNDAVPVTHNDLTVETTEVPVPAVTRPGGRGAQDFNGIAVIGLSGRYPQARTLDEFWQNLKEGRDCITEIPANRWPLEKFFREGVEAALAEGKSYCKWGGFLDGFAEFDPMFFRIAPGEAQNMDPQERLFMQSCWEVIEDAGYTRESLAVRHASRVGVFAGITKTGFDLYGPELWRQGDSAFPHTSFGSTANRVSYVLNLQGPSMPVDTQCSSSLTAVHLACESLLRGECELALAGGVNLYLHPASYMALCNLRMLSPEGRCNSFGAGGNGMVPGEGVGTVLLKPLSAALADGDHIYGVIRGTSVNHGGKTSGYTVPNPRAQAELIRAALHKAGVSADTVGYLEAHGTGTELGDPIEIAALSEAFGATASNRQFCAIGSVKSNIGHCESAAGIAGLTKVLLQMKHGVLVPSLHAQALNPHIDFRATPFLVQRELAPWQRGDHPRRAGISSFGAGGANAHIVVEEFVPLAENNPPRSGSHSPAVIVLSARDEARLFEQAEQLARFLESHATADEELANIAYTLQVGREAMEERLALLVGSAQELRHKLGRWLAHEMGIEELYRGTAQPNSEALELFAGDEDLQEAIAGWMAKKKYSKLAQLWVRGLSLDWSRLYAHNQVRRVSLPTYPFAKEWYWVPQLKAAGSGRSGVQMLHPLTQRNTSDLWKTRYTSTFTGTESWLADHVVNGLRVLPAAAYLEMVRFAVCDASGDEPPTGSICLEHVVWSQPVIVGAEAVDIHVELAVDERQAIHFEVRDDQGVTLCQGTARWLAVERQSLELQALQAGLETTLEGESCYAAFSSLGLKYGPTHRTLRSLKVGRDNDHRRCVVASIESPSAAADAAAYVLHPSILDGALQGIVGLELGVESPRASVPFSVERVEILGRCPTQTTAVIRDSRADGIGPRKVDIDVCDVHGEVSVTIRGLSMRELRAKERDRATLLGPHWMVSEGWKLAPNGAHLPVGTKQWVLLCGGSESDAEDLQQCIPGATCLALRTSESGVAERFTESAVHLLTITRGLLGGRPGNTSLIQLLVLETERPENALLAGLGAFLSTAQQENPALHTQVIEIEGKNSVARLAARLQDAASCSQPRLRYRDEERSVSVMRPLPSSERDVLPWKRGGVYLLSGGAGGLGTVFSREIVGRVGEVTLILAGRSQLGAEKLRMIETLTARGASVQPLTLDVSDRAEVNRAVAQIRGRYGRLDGVIHAAGIIKDSFLLNKTEEELRSVLAAKVSGAVNLDEATAECALDFFVLFGSMAGIAGGVGQADYAAANAFLDEYARCRAKWVDEGKRSGHSVAIDWPEWVNGGMKTSTATATRLDALGLSALTDEMGIESFYAAIATGESQVCVLRESSGQREEGVRDVTPRHHHHGELAERTGSYLKRIVAKALNVGMERVADDVPLEQYGVDSILMMRMTQELEKRFGPLSKTLFFEYPTLKQLTGYFLEAHEETFHREVTATPRREPEKLAGASNEKSRRNRVRQPLADDRATRRESSGVAVIGMSGRYAGARNLEEYWDNLRSGRDCVREIPAARWDQSIYFDPQKGKLGKSYSKWGGFIDGVDEFDPQFFHISPREAVFVDPQERLFLQCAYETLEDAGYTRRSLAEEDASGQSRNRVGVFVGVMYEEYQLYGAQAQALGQPFGLPGSAASVANRVSYFCNFHGPSIAVDTMCSASLTALHLARESLLRGECDAAIAGGVNVSIHPNKYLLLSQGQFASSKGRCESFGEGGDGYVPGEGVGAVLLKRLEDAEQAGDRIYGVIRGTSINHGGRTNGYTVPNPRAQAEVIRSALQASGVGARAVSYVEAHGTGTSLGDPVEIAGLSKAFGLETADKQFCAIGSVKSNIGHCESAAGIAGLTKILLQMKHGLLAPSLHSQTLNPGIDFAASPFFVQRELSEWQRPLRSVSGVLRDQPRIAGISAFGAGGSNAHAVIEEFVGQNLRPEPIDVSRPAVVLISATDEERLGAQVTQLLCAIESGRYSDSDLERIAYTLQVGREAFHQRLAVLTSSLEDLAEKLRRFCSGEQDIEDVYRGEAKRGHSALAAFTADEDLQAAVAAWLEKKKYSRLLELWVNGLEMDWKGLYGAVKPQRISLPTYCFARDRYWPTPVAGESHVVNKETAHETATAARAADESVPESIQKPRALVLGGLDGLPTELTEELPVRLTRKPLTDELSSASRPISMSVERVQDVLARTLADVLFLDVTDVDLDRPFAEMGLDSVTGVEWAREISRHYGVVIAAAKIYDLPSIGQFSHYVLGELKARGEPELLGLEARAGVAGGIVLEEPAAQAIAADTQVRLPSLPAGALPSVRGEREDAIAIVGMSARYPGAMDLEEFWCNLAAGKDCVQEIPDTRWVAAEHYDARRGQPGKVYCKWLGALSDVECFDPLFFGISPAEAQRMDPQQRLFLQEGYRAIEDAGYDPRSLSNRKCGVYLGIMGNEYGSILQASGAMTDATGNSASIAASRIAYVLNLKGPAISIDTACSSSLVATHLGCQALRAQEVDLALVGGVTLYLTAGPYFGMCAAGMLSGQGRCKTLDNSADGFVPGEGVGALVLKRLGDARRAGDRIHGVIIGSGINQDGKTNGIMAPNGTSQSELIGDVYERYGVDPQSISYVELHGTGTKLGDPVELGALAEVFKHSAAGRNACALGSVKSNLGHTSAAAGVAGVHKVLLCLRHRELVPTLHFQEPNEHFDFAASPFYVNTQLRPWEAALGRPRRAAVSSFGYSGTNAHVVIEEYAQAEEPEAGIPVSRERPAIIVLSARQEEQLKERARQLLQMLEQDELRPQALLGLAYTLQTGRELLERRVALAVSSIEELKEKLRGYLQGHPGLEGVYEGDTKRARETLSVLAGEDLAQLVEGWVACGEYGKLLELWVKGLKFDWQRLYRAHTPRRVSLPTYPFARERYWADAPGPAAGIRTRRCLLKQWRSAPIDTTSQSTTGGAMILASPETVALARRVGSLFPTSRVLVCNPDDNTQPIDIPFELFATWIDLVGCGTVQDTSTRWIEPLQQWIASGKSAGMTALCVTRSLEAHENRHVNLAGALRAGLYRMLGFEYGRIRSRHVDTDLDGGEDGLLEQIRLECLSKQEDVEVCYRRGRRFVSSLAEIGHDTTANLPVAANFPRDAVLWVSGGTRGLGYRCAEHFVRVHKVARVVLTGRTPLPDRECWASARLDSADIAARIEAVEALESLGAEVRVSSVQLTDREALQRELAEIRRTLGPIAGVLHCAGHFDMEEPAFIRKSRAAIDAVLAPKVAGLDNLIRSLPRDSLRFMVLFSSVAAVIPSLAVGHSDYAMANSYMDYVAQAYSAELPVVSVQWSSWKQSGVGEVTSRAFRDAGLLSQTDEEGLAILDEIIRTQPATVVLPVIASLRDWQPDRLMRASAIRQVPLRTSAEGTRYMGSSASLLERTQEWLKTLIGEHLKMEVAQLDMDTPLQDYGVDSVFLMHLARPVAALIEAPVDPASFFEHQTIASYARWLTDSHRERLMKSLGGRGESPDAQLQTESSAEQTSAAPAQIAPGAKDIAVVGLACRFAGAANLAEYWELLAGGRSAIGPVPANRARLAVNQCAALLENTTLFDPKFFRMDATDAAAVDPQALILLEESLDAVCHAGYTLREIKGARMGVYIGARAGHRPDPQDLLQAKNAILAVGQNYLAANVSRFFDLRGPSLVVDTACSSALVAMSLAAQALHSGTIDSALVGAVSVLNLDEHLPLFAHRGLLQPESRFHIFDQRAQGSILGEGAGVVLLKTLDRALQDGDEVYGVIKALAVNNDGQTLGPTAPSMQAQKEVMLTALQQSGLQGGDVSYVEVNGAGSEPRDLIELRCIETVYRPDGQIPCELGSMKPNIGHSLCAEGIAGFIKTILMLHKGAIVPFLSGEQPGPHYNFAASPFHFTRELRSWEAPRRAAAINCFADGGTNTHVIVAAAAAQPRAAGRRVPLPPPPLERVDVAGFRHASLVARGVRSSEQSLAKTPV